MSVLYLISFFSISSEPSQASTLQGLNLQVVRKTSLFVCLFGLISNTHFHRIMNAILPRAKEAEAAEVTAHSGHENTGSEATVNEGDLERPCCR